jgi:hypothetical protein
MGVRPPTNDGDDEPETVTFGIAALDARLDDAEISYPVDADEVVATLGDPEIPYDATGNGVTLSEALDRTHFSRFETEQELLNALHPVFESYRERTSNSFIAQLRALFPF